MIDSFYSCGKFFHQENDFASSHHDNTNSMSLLPVEGVTAGEKITATDGLNADPLAQLFEEGGMCELVCPLEYWETQCFHEMSAVIVNKSIRRFLSRPVTVSLPQQNHASGGHPHSNSAGVSLAVSGRTNVFLDSNRDRRCSVVRDMFLCSSLHHDLQLHRQPKSCMQSDFLRYYIPTMIQMLRCQQSPLLLDAPSDENENEVSGKRRTRSKMVRPKFMKYQYMTTLLPLSESAYDSLIARFAYSL